MAKGTLRQGQSDLATEAKQRGLYYAFELGAAVIRKNASWVKPYLHFDINAGSGYNEIIGCDGSPITFTRVFHDLPHFRATFIDCDAEQISTLSKRPLIRDDPRCRLHHGDNAEFLRTLQINGTWQFGTILSDPNGSDIPIEELIYTSRRYHQIDHIYHWNSTITKRLKYGIKPSQIVLSDIPKLILKKFWLIREPIGPHQFAMLIGRNYRGNDWRSGGFYHLDSSQGEAIMDRCSRSNKERRAEEQPGFEFGETG
jgi:hypothetical protein